MITKCLHSHILVPFNIKTLVLSISVYYLGSDLHIQAKA